MKVPRLIVKLFAMYKIAADSRGMARDGSVLSLPLEVKCREMGADLTR